MLFSRGFIWGSLGVKGQGLGKIASQVHSETSTSAELLTALLPWGCAEHPDSPLHRYGIIWIFQFGTGSQGAGKGVAGLSSCHHAGTPLQGPRNGEAACSTRRAWAVLGKLGTVETCRWVSLPTQTCLGLLIEKPQERFLKLVGFFGGFFPPPPTLTEAGLDQMLL